MAKRRSWWSNSALRQAIALTEGGGYDPDAALLFAALPTMPTAAEKTAINDLIIAYKASGTWAASDDIWWAVPSNAQSIRTGWKTRTATLTAVGTPTFGLYGVTGNGTDGALTMTTNASALAKYARNDAHMSAWVRTQGTAGRFVLGIGGGTGFRLAARSGAGAEVRVNTSTTLALNDGLTVGKVTGVRRDSANQYLYRNGGGEVTGAATSAALPASPWSFLLSGTTYDTAEISGGHLGAQISAAADAADYAAELAYLTAIGGYP